MIPHKIKLLRFINGILDTIRKQVLTVKSREPENQNPGNKALVLKLWL